MRRATHRLAALLAAGAVLTSGCTVASVVGSAIDALTSDSAQWDPGNIISDAVFYNAAALPNAPAVQAALDKVGGSCSANTCLRNAVYTNPNVTSQWCNPYNGGTETYAQMLYKMAQACGINPQVAIVIVQKESQGVTREVPPAALTGYGCPDTGPNGSANCSSAVGGVFNQTWGLFQAFAHARKDDSVVQRYIEGTTPHDIFWNVEETGCGAAPVTVKNRATATLYTYTPYQPNAASLAAYPGEGDACSSYGNRNFFRMFQSYFGTTGGGQATPGGSTVVANGPNITIPDNEFVVAPLRGKTIQAPTAAMAKGIAAGFGALGMPYVWGGGGDGAGPNNGCSRGGGDFNSCGSTIGFDCSGLTAYVYVQGGMPSPGGSSGDQRAGGQSVSYDQGLPGDIVGFPGHVAIFLGNIDGTPYILEASWVGTPIHIVPLTRSDRDGQLHRYWTSTA
jgi:cell wall-associated NlpC family hydrolase